MCSVCLPVIRNLSSVNERTRQKMREMPGLVDSLVCYIQQEEAGDDKVARRSLTTWDISWHGPQWGFPNSCHHYECSTKESHSPCLFLSSSDSTHKMNRQSRLSLLWFTCRVWRILSAWWGISPTSCTRNFQHQCEYVLRAHPELQPSETTRPLAALHCTTKREFRYVGFSRKS